MIESGGRVNKIGGRHIEIRLHLALWGRTCGQWRCNLGQKNGDPTPLSTLMGAVEGKMAMAMLIATISVFRRSSSLL